MSILTAVTSSFGAGCVGLVVAGAGYVGGAVRAMTKATDGAGGVRWTPARLGCLSRPTRLEWTAVTMV